MADCGKGPPHADTSTSPTIANTTAGARRQRAAPLWEVDRETRRPDALQIDVTGYQWWWQFEYPGFGVVTANEVHVPVGRTVQFRLTSADVIHSFWFPRQGGKRDVIPGKTNILWFRPDSIGRFPGQCAEFCGLSHALMKMEIVVETEEEFDAWVERQRQPAPVLQQVDVPGEAAQARDIAAAADTMPPEEAVEGPDSVPGVERVEGGEAAEDAAAAPQDADLARIVEEGSRLFMSKGCLACHRIQGTPAAGVLGPDLSHVGSRHTIAAGILENTQENRVEWIRDPMAVKPGAKMPALELTEEELQTLATYLGSLE